MTTITFRHSQQERPLYLLLTTTNHPPSCIQFWNLRKMQLIDTQFSVHSSSKSLKKPVHSLRNSLKNLWALSSIWVMWVVDMNLATLYFDCINCISKPVIKRMDTCLYRYRCMDRDKTKRAWWKTNKEQQLNWSLLFDLINLYLYMTLTWCRHGHFEYNGIHINMVGITRSTYLGKLLNTQHMNEL